MNLHRAFVVVVAATATAAGAVVVIVIVAIAFFSSLPTLLPKHRISFPVEI